MPRRITWAPSPLNHERYYGTTRELPDAMIADIIEGYALTAERMVEAGYDGVEIVASHGYLPATTAPFEVGGDPGKPDFRVRDLDLFPGITGPRLAQRKSYLAALDRFRGQTEDSSDVPDDPIFEQAYRMLTSESARAAFDIGEESDVTRRRYGPKSVGQSCLLARRLIERGVVAGEFECTDPEGAAARLTALRDGLVIEYSLFQPEQPNEMLFDLLRGSIKNNLGLSTDAYTTLAST